MRERWRRASLDDQPDYSVLKTGGDPYVYPGTEVLRNRLGIKNANDLGYAEKLLTRRRMVQLAGSEVKTPNTFEGFRAVHQYIFQDVYSWAGRTRKVELFKPEEVLRGASAPYSPPDAVVREAKAALKRLDNREWKHLGVDDQAETLSKDLGELWRVHAFREGNTRTVVAFADKFTREKGMRLDTALLKEHSSYVRNALVASSVDSPDSLKVVLKDALEKGEKLKDEPRPTLKLKMDRDKDRG